MYIYTLSYIILFLLTSKEVIVKSFSKKRIKFILNSFLLASSVIAGIRYDIGQDYFNYVRMFSGIESVFDYAYLEPGFRFIVSFSKMLGMPENSLFFTFAFISLFFLVKGIKRSSESPVISLFIYWCVFYIGYIFNVMRQGIVMSIFVYLINDIQDRKLKKVIIFSLFAMTIHYSGIFIIIGYFFYKLNIDKKIYMITTIILSILTITNNYWMDVVIDSLPLFLKLKLSFYIYSFEDSVNLMGILQRLLILVPFIIYYNHLKKSHGSFEGVFKLYFLGYIFYSLFSFQGMFATRINMFYRILEIILFPYLLRLKINKYNKLFIFLFIILWVTLIYISELRNPANYPFKTIIGL